MKRTFYIYGTAMFFLLMAGLHFDVHAQANLSWVKGVGGVGNDAARTSVVDAAGNVYIGGNFSGNADFGVGGSGAVMSVGGLDAFVAKYDAGGNLVWVKTFGGTGTGAAATLDDYTYAVQVDPLGNVYATGFFQNTVDFNPSAPGLNVLTSAGMADIFIIKFDASGNFLWVKQVSGPSHQIGYGLKLDALGNIYVSGAFIGSADFDPDPVTTAPLTAYSTGYDAFLAKYDNNGNYIWAKKFGSTTTNGTDNFWNIDIDVNGNIYAIGYYSGTTDFDPGAGVANLASSGQDAVVAQYTSDGDYRRAFRLTGTGSQFGRSVKADNIGNFYITGYYGGTPDFDPGTGIFNLASTNNEIFLAKYDTLNNFQWARRIGGSSHDQGWEIDMDQGGVYLTGYFTSSSLNFYQPDGTTALSGATIANAGGVTTAAGGTNDAFIAKYDTAGAFQWSYGIGGTTSPYENDYGYAISVHPVSGDLYAGGSYSSTVDFDFDTPVTTITATDANDIYLAKYLTSPLPVRMSNLTGALNGDHAILRWQTYNEVNNKGFEIERSADGKEFENIGYVGSKSSTSFAPLEYSFIDYSVPSREKFYRLRQIDLNGKTTYSNIISLTNESHNSSISMYPNPVQDVLTIRLPPANEATTIFIRDIMGRVVVDKVPVSQGSAFIQVKVGALPPGVYFIHVAGESTETVSQFVK